MRLGSNQLFLLYLVNKNGFISQIEVVHVYNISAKNRARKSKMILDKLEFLDLIKKTDEKTGFNNQFFKYVLTDNGKKILIARSPKKGDVDE